jgi:hypothetical protein
MLLNSDINFFLVQTILQFQKERNVIMYIIEIFKKKSNHFIQTKSQLDMNFQILCFCNI